MIALGSASGAALLTVLACVLFVVAITLDNDPLLIASASLASLAMGLAVGAWVG